MRGLTRCARYLVPSALVVCLMSLGAPCAAQENGTHLLSLLYPIQAMDVAHYSRLRPGWC